MKKFLIALLLVTIIVGVNSYLQAQSYTFEKQGTQNHKIGFGSVITPNSHGSIAISACDGMSKINDCSHSAQIGTGTQSNDALGRQSLGGDESVKYRSSVILEDDGVLGIRVYGTMLLNYAMWKEEFNYAGYVAGAVASVTDSNGHSRVVGHCDFSETAYAGNWLVTVVDGAGDDSETIRIDDNANSLLEIVGNDASNDTVQVQVNGEPFHVRAGKEMWFQCRFAVTDVTNSQFAVGLTVRSQTDMIGTPGNDCIYFSVAPHGGLISWHVIQNGTETTASTGIQILDTVPHNVAFYWDGNDSLTLSVDGTSYTTNIVDNGTTVVFPDDEEMTAFIALEAHDADAAKTCQVDYIGVINTR